MHFTCLAPKLGINNNKHCMVTSSMFILAVINSYLQYEKIIVSTWNIDHIRQRECLLPKLIILQSKYDKNSNIYIRLTIIHVNWREDSRITTFPIRIILDYRTETCSPTPSHPQLIFHKI